MQDPLHIEEGMRGKHNIGSKKSSACVTGVELLAYVHKAGPVSKK